MAEWLWHRTSTMFAKDGHSLFSYVQYWSINTEIGTCVMILILKAKRKITKLTLNRVAHFEEHQTESYRQLPKPFKRWQALDFSVLYEIARFESREWPPLQSWWLSG
ncbi:hypothetical protein TNCT_357731 [Trichonephila clavata]|uniref:Uncharacterized protein n=1 Tax=Trichonephila clavata TaxID=2740835 RepID=A0A8X6M5G3_TRICU|nr:hypothetical protein TNCT_357731 [Trichonephila clavata]